LQGKSKFSSLSSNKQLYKMKAFFTSLLLLTLTAVWGQRNCGTMDVLTEQLQQMC